MTKTSAELERDVKEIARFLHSTGASGMDVPELERLVLDRRSRDPGAWSSREELVSVARDAAASLFASRKAAPSRDAVKKAEWEASKAIIRRDPLAGTSDHPVASYSYGVSELAAEGVAQAVREWRGRHR